MYFNRPVLVVLLNLASVTLSDLAAYTVQYDKDYTKYYALKTVQAAPWLKIPDD